MGTEIATDNTEFTQEVRQAKALASSTLVPEAYRGNVANVLVALELSGRVGASAMAVMQNLHIIHGKPSFSSSFLIGCVNTCGRFTPMRYRFDGEGDDYGCRAVATDIKSQDECLGPKVTRGMAKAEGWSTKAGSKWKTMEELMFIYRAAAFWTRIYAPEISLGMPTVDEVQDIRTVATIHQDRPAATRPRALMAATGPAQATIEHDDSSADAGDAPAQAEAVHAQSDDTSVF